MKRIFRYALAALGLIGVLTVSGPCAAQQERSAEKTPDRQLELTTYTGVISKVNDVETALKTLSFTLNITGQEKAIQVETAPLKYVQKIGLPFTSKQPVTVTGWEISQTAPALNRFVATTVSVNGTTYTLRDAKGVPAWTYWDTFMESVTVTGAVTKVQAAAVTTEEGLPGATINNYGVKYMTVKSGDKTYNVFLAPQQYLDAIKFAPAVGMEVTITGWTPVVTRKPAEGTAVLSALFVKQLTFGKTSYAFRDANAKVLWEAVKPDAKPEGQREVER